MAGFRTKEGATVGTLRERLEGLRQSWDDLADDTYGPHSFDFRCGVQRCEAELGLLIKALAAEGQGAPATNRTTLDECFGDPFIWCEGMDHSEALQGNDWILIRAPALRALAAAPSLHKEGLQSLSNCMDCGKEYGGEDWLDFTFSKAQWLLIHPADGGVLCANCVIRRASKLPHVINITGKITFVDDYNEPAALHKEGAGGEG